MKKRKNSFDAWKYIKMKIRSLSLSVHILMMYWCFSRLPPSFALALLCILSRASQPDSNDVTKSGLFKLINPDVMVCFPIRIESLLFDYEMKKALETTKKQGQATNKVEKVSG